MKKPLLTRLILRTSSYTLWMLIGFFCLETTNLQGQLPQENEEIEEAMADSLREEKREPEDPFRFDPGNQIRVFYPGMDRPDYTFSDTIFGPEFLQYDPARRNVDIGHLHGGYVGSAIFPTYFDYQREMGFEVGHRAYDLYKLDLDTLPYYESDVAYSDVMYAQGASQSETQTQANFGTQFTDQYISINYRRINNTGDLNNQRSVHTALSMGYLYETENHLLNVKFGSNVIQDKFNNGIQTDSLFGENLAGVGSNIPVISEESQARHQQRKFIARYDRKISNLTFIDRWSVRGEVENSYIKIFDESPDSSFYTPFYTDERGLRQFIGWSKWKAQFQFSKESSTTLRYTAGIRTHRINAEQEPVKFSFWEWQGYGRIKLFLSEKLKLDARAEFGVQDNQPEFLLGTKLKAGGKLLSLTGIYEASSLVPDLVERQLYLENDELFAVSTTNILHNKIGGNISSKKVGIMAELFFHNIDNFRYWKLGDLIPNRDNLSLLQGKIKQNWKWKALRNENIVAFQFTDQDQLPLPTWQGRHTLYLDTKIFGRTMHIRTGLEGRYYLNYTAPQYQPFYGSFFVINEGLFDSFPYLVDYFLAFDVQSFHFLLRLENLNSFIDETRFYGIARQPSRPFSFRVSIRWRIPG